MVTYLVVEIKKKSILCAVDEMKIVIYECLAHFFLLLYNYRTLGWLFISKYLSHGKTSTTNTHTFRLNTPNVNRNSGHTSFVMEIVYLSMSLSLGSTENLTLLGHTYTRTWHPLDLTLTGFFKDDEIEFFVARRRNLPDLIMYVWNTAILDFSVRSGGINKCDRR